MELPPTPGSDSGSSGDRTPRSPSHILTQGLQTLVARGGMVLLSFALAVVVARALDPAGRGRFALLQALNGFAVVVANFAIGRAVIFHVGKGLLTVRRATGAAVTLALVSGVAATLVLFPIALALRDRLFPGIAPVLIGTALALATPILLREYLAGAMTAVGRPLAVIGAIAVQPLVSLAVLSVILIIEEGSLQRVVAAWALGILASGLAAFALSFRFTRPWPNFKLPDLLALGRFGLRTYPAFVARFLNLRIDQFLVGILAGAAALGQYAVAVNVGELLVRIPNVLLLAVSGELSAADRGRSADLVIRFCRWSLIMLTAAVAIIAILAPIGIPLVFGPAYRPSIGPVLLLLPGMVFYAPATFISEYFIVQRGNPARAAWIAGVSMVASVVLNLFLVPILEAAGASIASSLSYALMFLFGVVLFARDTGLPAASLLTVGRRDLASLLGALRRVVQRPRDPGGQ
jgi:O-antigen/teichoic acid export membrane protein